MEREKETLTLELEEHEILELQRRADAAGCTIDKIVEAILQHYVALDDDVRLKSAAPGMARSTVSKRRRRRMRGKLQAAKAAARDGDPRRAGRTSEMPDDLRALALDGLNQPYEP
ncbi:hypothetical protein [Rhodoblastus sp.]|jgi:hypothetical protein|uniref:hypothetical protein n=1 Tax=Rhodoblastus sp. TaxID=1962975 RepID=UPI0025F7A6D1|nr:hypothetical protein [Rhodoblastus sp.]